MRRTTSILTALASTILTTGLFATGCSTDVAQDEANTRASESVHAFECVTLRPMADGAKHDVSFSVVGLRAPEFDEDFVWPEDDGEGDCPDCPVSVTPESSDLMALNENGVVLREDGKLVVKGDADGFYGVTLALYENSGYTKGYVRIEDGGGFVEERYSEVHCTVTELTPPPASDRADVSEIIGFYSNGDYEYEETSPLTVALYGASDALPDGYDGFVDLANWDPTEYGTNVTRGWFTVEENEGSLTLKVVDETGEPIGSGAWPIVDGRLQVEGASMYHLNQLSRERYIEQCYALEVLEYEFEEGFTPEEYPGVDVGIDEDGNYEVGFGATNFDASEAEITVGENEAGDFEATVKTEWSTYVLRIPDESPRRGQVLFLNDAGDLEVMANVGCYQ